MNAAESRVHEGAGQSAGAWHRLGAYIWRKIETGGMARAAVYLDQVALRYAPMQPEFAEDIRAASRFADRLALY